MGLLRRVALIVLWTLAGIGVLCGAAWGATALGVIQPLVVVSGSMQPTIMTGDLLIATRVDPGMLRPGDIVSLHSDLTAGLVTHRIQSIDRTGADSYTIVLKGDANAGTDPLPYDVSGSVWSPAVQVPGGGLFFSRLTSPAVAIPLVIGLLALFALTVLVPAPERRGKHPPLRGRSAPSHFV